MDEVARQFATVVFATVALAFLFVLGARLVLLSKKGSAAAHVLGATFMLIGFGNMRDPSNEIVQAAKEHKQRKENDQGDPPDADR
jgi:hypothetical protein